MLGQAALLGRPLLFSSNRVRRGWLAGHGAGGHRLLVSAGNDLIICDHIEHLQHDVFGLGDVGNTVNAQGCPFDLAKDTDDLVGQLGVDALQAVAGLLAMTLARTQHRQRIGRETELLQLLAHKGVDLVTVLLHFDQPAHDARLVKLGQLRALLLRQCQHDLPGQARRRRMDDGGGLAGSHVEGRVSHAQLSGFVARLACRDDGGQGGAEAGSVRFDVGELHFGRFHVESFSFVCWPLGPVNGRFALTIRLVNPP